MNSSSSLIPVAQAQARLLGMVRPVPSETVPLIRAVGRFAATDIAARRAQPGADLSAMDGYAIRFDTLPGPWRMIGESAAGRGFGGSVRADETVRIFTGAAMPDGTDAVLIQEEAQADGRTIRLTGEGPLRRGGNVRPQGLDFREGEILIAKGEHLTPARLALAAIGGYGDVAVARPVRVAIVATGDELAPPGTAIGPGQLPESNSAMLAAMLAGWPVETIDLGILPDRLDALRDTFAAVGADILVTTGGASVGDHDLVRPALEAAGGTVDFWRIALRPGKPMMAGRLGDTLVLGLPGNPVSAFVTATLFLRPLVAARAGARDPLPRTEQAILGHDLPANDGRQDYVRAERHDGRVFPLGMQDSSMLRTLARADCLAVRPPHAPAASAGETIEIISLA